MMKSGFQEKLYIFVRQKREQYKFCFTKSNSPKTRGYYVSSYATMEQYGFVIRHW